MIDGNIKIKLSLKQTAKELAEAAGTLELIHYDEAVKTYYIKGVNEEMLLQNGFKFYERSFNKTPIYKKENIFASYNSDTTFETIMVYKNVNDKLSYKEE